MSHAAVLILAAGMSRRLGRAKQVLPLDGKPLVAHVGRKAQASRATRVVAVVGGAKHDTSAALDGIVDELVVNGAFTDGQGTSIAAGISHLESTGKILGVIDAVVILLGDQPGIDTTAINGVISAWEQGGLIAMAQYDDRAGHPVLFDRRYFAELVQLSGDSGGKTIIANHRDDVVYVPIEGRSPMDIDTEADWRSLQEHWSH